MKRLKLFACIALLFAPLLLSQQGYIPFATEFDGSSDYYLRGADLTGNADGTDGTVSFWYRLDGGDGDNLSIGQGSAGFYLFARTTLNRFEFHGFTSGASQILRIHTTSGSNVASASWHHIVASWSLGATPVAHIYVDGVSDKTDIVLTAGDIDYTRVDHAIGALTTAASIFNGALSELYFALEFIDFSIEANRRLFITADLKPVDLGPGCHKPTGTVALLCMQTQFNGFGQNSGSGGDFTPQDPTTWTAGPVPILQLPGRATPVRRGRGGSRRSTPRE